MDFSNIEDDINFIETLNSDEANNNNDEANNNNDEINNDEVNNDEVSNDEVNNDEVNNDEVSNDEVSNSNNEVNRKIISLIIDISNNVFNSLGKGFNECIYHKAILVDLYKTKYQIETKKIIPIEYNDVNVGYVESDVIVYDLENNRMIIIELKAQTNDLSYKEKFQVQKYMNHINNINHTIEKKNIIGLVINFSQKNNTCLKVQNFIVENNKN